MKKVIMILLVISFGALIAPGVNAQCNMDTSSGGAVEIKNTGEPINDTCPVMGGPIEKNTPYKAEYNGKTIGFCCEACVKSFNADPEKYMAIIEKK